MLSLIVTMLQGGLVGPVDLDLNDKIRVKQDDVLIKMIKERE